MKNFQKSEIRSQKIRRKNTMPQPPMKRIAATLTGTSPLLMHRFPLTPIEAFDKLSPQEQAEHSAYRDERGLFIPGVNLQRALVSGAAFSKGKGRASLAKSVAACVFVPSERLHLDRGEFTIDSRAVVMPATRGRVVRHRAKLNQWQVDVLLEFDSTLITESQLRRVVEDTGSRVGLLDFRPEKKGPFGRFVVTKWEATK